jgi:hypothetical protein
MVKLASHDVRAVREAAWAFLRGRLAELKTDGELLSQAVRVLEAKWEDSRVFGCAFFREHFDNAHWAPGLLIGICDSVRPDIQQFGRELITRFFREADGDEYLRKLSEHPSMALQLFATNYLEQHAASQPARLRELSPYFTSVLARVNRGGVAKRRIHAFLLREALKSDEAARLIAEVLARQSATMAIQDRERCIETLLRIQQAYPFIPVPLVPRPAPLREVHRGI